MGIGRLAGRVQEAFRVAATPPQSMGQNSPAAQLLQLQGGGFASRRPAVRRKVAAGRSTKVSRKKSATTYRTKASAKRAKAGKTRLVKGSPAAKAWGRKMARARKR